MTSEEIRKNLEEWLNKIGYRLVSRGCDHYEIINHLGISTGINYFGEFLETEGQPKIKSASKCIFYIKLNAKETTFRVHDTTLAIGSATNFVLLFNYEKAKEPKP